MTEEETTGPMQYRLAIREEADVQIAKKRVRDLAKAEGLSAAEIEAVSKAVSEIAQNIVVHAQNGEMFVSVVRENARHGIVIIARDEGPGIPDVTLAMVEGFSTSDSLGLGLSSASRLMDDFDLKSDVGEGTTITMRKWSQWIGVGTPKPTKS